jgi:hypothetical protein
MMLVADGSWHTKGNSGGPSNAATTSGIFVQSSPNGRLNE